MATLLSPRGKEALSQPTSQHGEFPLSIYRASCLGRQETTDSGQFRHLDDIEGLRWTVEGTLGKPAIGHRLLTRGLRPVFGGSPKGLLKDVRNQRRRPGKNEQAVAGYSGCWELLATGTLPASVDPETYFKFGTILVFRFCDRISYTPRLDSYL